MPHHRNYCPKFILENIKSSKILDLYFGLDYRATESQLNIQDYPEETYVGHGLLEDALNNTYYDLYQILNQIKGRIPNKHSFIDLGCAQGRLGLLIGFLFPEYSYTGIDLISQRFSQAQRITSDLNISFEQENLMSSGLPNADFYFIYLPSGLLLKRIIEKLAIKSKTQEFHLVVIESDGEVLNLLDAIPWLQRNSHELPLEAPRHYKNAVLYKTQQTKPLPHLNQNSLPINRVTPYFFEGHDLNRFELLVEQYDGESFTLSIQELLLFFKQGEVNQVEGLIPHRIISPSHGKISLCLAEELYKSEKLLMVSRLRKEKRVSTITYRRDGSNLGELSVLKIILSPTLRIELSSGYRYPLDQLDFRPFGPISRDK